MNGNMERRLEEKAYMSKYLWGACAVSVLAVAYATHAVSDQGTTSAQIALSGTVPSYCTIVTDGRDSAGLALE